MVVLVNATAVPARVNWVRVVPFGPAVGTIAVSPLAPAPTLTVNDNVLAFQDIPENEDPLRPFSHSSICRAVTIGTPWASAEVSTWSLWNVVALSVCMLAVNAP